MFCIDSKSNTNNLKELIAIRKNQYLKYNDMNPDERFYSWRSLLSHSAIVSRELGIPAVVGITGLISPLKDGDIVEFDGTTGDVKIIA